MVLVLQIKAADGRAVYEAKFWAEQTIGEVEAALAGAGAGAVGRFELRTAFPNKVYTDPAESLHQAGLVPNAVMMLRPKPVAGGDGGDGGAVSCQTEPEKGEPVGGSFSIASSWAGGGGSD